MGTTNTKKPGDLLRQKAIARNAQRELAEWKRINGVLPPLRTGRMGPPAPLAPMSTEMRMKMEKDSALAVAGRLMKADPKLGLDDATRQVREAAGWQNQEEMDLEEARMAATVQMRGLASTKIVPRNPADPNRPFSDLSKAMRPVNPRQLDPQLFLPRYATVRTPSLLGPN
jgi:hypothetical protein